MGGSCLFTQVFLALRIVTEISGYLEFLGIPGAVIPVISLVCFHESFKL